MKLYLTLALLILAVCQILGSANACGSGSGRGSSEVSDRQEAQKADAGASSDGAAKVRVSGRIRLSPALDSIPANSRLVVSLQDISLMDAPSKLLNRQTLSSVSAAYNADRSIPYSIEATIPASTPLNPYSVSVSASLSGDGVSYITDTAYYVDLKPNTFEYKSMDFTIVNRPSLATTDRRLGALTDDRCSRLCRGLCSGRLLSDYLNRRSVSQAARDWQANRRGRISSEVTQRLMRLSSATAASRPARPRHASLVGDRRLLATRKATVSAAAAVFSTAAMPSRKAHLPSNILECIVARSQSTGQRCRDVGQQINSAAV